MSTWPYKKVVKKKIKNIAEYNRNYYAKNKHTINLKRASAHPKVNRSFLINNVRYKECPSCLKIKSENEYSRAIRIKKQPWQYRSLCKPCTSDQTMFYNYMKETYFLDENEY